MTVNASFTILSRRRGQWREMLKGGIST